jgi:hypothetical protein
LSARCALHDSRPGENSSCRFVCPAQGGGYDALS